MKVAGRVPRRSGGCRVRQLVKTLLSDRLGRRRGLSVVRRRCGVPADRRFERSIEVVYGLDAKVRRETARGADRGFVLGVCGGNCALSRVTSMTRANISRIRTVVGGGRPTVTWLSLTGVGHGFLRGSVMCIAVLLLLEQVWEVVLTHAVLFGCEDDG